MIRSYRVYCSFPYRPFLRGGRQRQVAAGLDYRAARILAERLQAVHDLRHPRRTSWTKRLYLVELE